MTSHDNKKMQPPVAFRSGSHHKIGAPVIKPKNLKATLLRLWDYLKYQKIKLILVIIMVIISSLLMLAGPYLIGVAIDYYIIPRDFPGLLKIVLLLIAAYVLSALANWLQMYLMVDVSQKTVFKIRKDVFDKLQSLPLKFFDSNTRGELMSRLTNDIDNISNTLNSSSTQIISSIISITGTVIMMLYLSPILTFINMLIIPVMLFITGKIAKRSRKYFLNQQAALGKLNGMIEESISGQRVIKVFTREEKQIEEFNKSNEELKNIGIKALILSGFIPPLMNLLNNINFAFIAGVGGWLAVREIITIGVIASFINYSKQFTRPINELANQINMFQTAIAGAERVFEIMDESPEKEDEKDAIRLSNISGKVDFENVTFSYDKKTPVLKNINLHINPGETIALVGPTGAGKTTIINLLTRFYDIDEGLIKIDGTDIRKINRKSLRSSLGIVLQDAYLFSESVRENIRYGRLDASDEEVEEAAKLANAHKFIKRLPQGYDTVLSEEASNLSQGQRQLITIARAILANPSILILDEATSSVDTRTELHIQEAMLNLMKGRTSFVIAHRLSTIRDADQIVVINDGKIIEKGKHDELLKQRGFYYNLYMTQFKNQTI
ncbi:MAG TPA: ABC transporter ATP-binding protein [Defluviitaleaceae bacterium]|nr:ABC transporter ATP-binding protein [Candidatus Epulonipiscium sp.]HOQ17244.1 ABC transporter ATP-binding protein [Defluviitaleaceae bacterium]HQD50779.1 ABC transporter ATP-binding protein [Defluviitaleaceae bacterium]